MANQDHLDLLKRGVEFWNKWRGSLDFLRDTEALLHGPDLSKADLSKAILKKANLTCANLRGADLVNANLTLANLDFALQLHLFGDRWH